MKIKKLVSIGALALVVACSTSIGASAAERPDNAKIKSDMINMFITGQNPLNYKVNASTKVGNVINITKLQDDLNDLGFGTGSSYSTLNDALGLVESNQTVMYNAKKIVVNLNGNLDELLSEVRSMTIVLRDIENSADPTTKVKIENDIKALVKGSNSTLDVAFGKNIDGKITMTITQGNQIVLQLNSGNAYTINNSLGTNADKLETYVGLLGLFS